jgi:hypothetical protein
MMEKEKSWVCMRSLLSTYQKMEFYLLRGKFFFARVGIQYADEHKGIGLLDIT